MPFVSESQRRKFHVMAARGEMPQSTVDEWEAATPKGKKLPQHVKKKKLPKRLKKAYAAGADDALITFGLKSAAQEVRLQIPRREFHGFDGAFRSESTKNLKKADEQPPAPGETSGADMFAQALEQLPPPPTSAEPEARKDPLDRVSTWGAPSNLAGGDTGSRVNMQQGAPNGMV